MTPPLKVAILYLYFREQDGENTCAIPAATTVDFVGGGRTSAVMISPVRFPFLPEWNARRRIACNATRIPRGLPDRGREVAATTEGADWVTDGED